jgi:hypothetical protein
MNPFEDLLNYFLIASFPRNSDFKLIKALSNRIGHPDNKGFYDFKIIQDHVKISSATIQSIIERELGKNLDRYYYVDCAHILVLIDSQLSIDQRVLEFQKYNREINMPFPVHDNMLQTGIK